MHTGLAVITGTEDRQHAYPALTRGTDANLAYVFTVSPKLADPVPGPRPAPELARYDQIHTERGGDRAPVTGPAPAGTALGALSAVLDRDGQQLSATQTRQQALLDADHLALLHAIWTDQTAPGHHLIHTTNPQTAPSEANPPTVRPATCRWPPPIAGNLVHALCGMTGSLETLRIKRPSGAFLCDTAGRGRVPAARRR